MVGMEKIAYLCASTLDPVHRKAAEEQLNQMRKIIDFGPMLLEHVRDAKAELPSRTAAVLFLKNYILHHWEDVTEGETQKARERGEALPFNIHEQDRAILRDKILETVIDSPEVLRVQLAVALETICKADFPGRWSDIVQRVNLVLSSPQHDLWYGALIALYRLIHAFEYRAADDRVAIDEAMKFLQPLLLQRLQELTGDTSEPSMRLVKTILKIFYCYIQFDFPMKIFNFEITEQWIMTILRVFDSAVPSKVSELEEDERQDTIWWKCKKWCLHIFAKIFDRYGSPKDVKKEYLAFANFFVGKLAKVILQSVFVLLDSYIRGTYISPRCLQQSLAYVRQALKVPSCWKLIKPHAHDLLSRVIFPIMCFKEDDKEQWEDNPIEWILERSDVHAEFMSAEAAAQYLLHTLCKKHPNLIPDILTFTLGQMTPDPARVRQKDGALHFLGIMGRVLMRRKPYKDQVEQLLVMHGYPEMRNAEPFIRYRAVWLFRQFSYLEYKNKDHLYMGLESTLLLLMEPSEQLPVRVEAALTLNEVLDNQKAAEDFLRPHAISILRVTLELVHLTNYEELSEVLQTFVVEFPEEVSVCATELAQHLLVTFQTIVDKRGAEEEERSSVLTGMSVLQTLELLNDCTSEKPQLNAQLAPIVIQVIEIILKSELSEYYEEMFGLLTSLTSKQISPALWQGLDICAQILRKTDSGIDYFTDMIVCLYNYATRDAQGLLSDPRRLQVMCEMCEHVLGNDDAGEDGQCQAAKLLEVLVLTYQGMITAYVPAIMQVVLQKLIYPANALLSELKTQLILVIIAALYYDTALALDFLNKFRAETEGEGMVLMKFLGMWLDEIDCMFGKHDKKMAVLGLTIFMRLPQPLRTHFAIQSIVAKLLPSCLLLFQGLKRIYTHKETDSDDEWEDEEEGEEEVVHTDEEDHEPSSNKMGGGGSDGAAADVEDEDDEDWQSEGYQSDTLKQMMTPVDQDSVDEFAIFRQVVMEVQQYDPQWWTALAGSIGETNNNLLGEMLRFAVERHQNAPAQQPHVKQT